MSLLQNWYLDTGIDRSLRAWRIVHTLGDLLWLTEARCATTHDFALADELGVEFGAIKGEVNVKVHTCISS